MKTDTRGRIFELDFLRGAALILMCLDHLCFDLACLPDWFPAGGDAIAKVGRLCTQIIDSRPRLILHYVFAALFLLLAGVGSALTRHPWKRFGMISGGAAAVTAATVLIEVLFHPSVAILFGVLSAMAVGAFLCNLCRFRGGRWVALAAGVGMVIVGFLFRWYDAPIFYSYPSDLFWQIVFGQARYGADWFPVFPSCGVILIGYFLGQTLYASRRSLIPALRGKTCFVCAVGRYPLWIYLTHQIVLGGVCCGIGALLSRC